MAAAPAVTTFSRATGEVGTLADDERPLALARTRPGLSWRSEDWLGQGLRSSCLCDQPRPRPAAGARRCWPRTPGRPCSGGARTAGATARGRLLRLPSPVPDAGAATAPAAAAQPARQRPATAPGATRTASAAKPAPAPTEHRRQAKQRREARKTSGSSLVGNSLQCDTVCQTMHGSPA